MSKEECSNDGCVVELSTIKTDEIVSVGVCVFLDFRR